MRSTKAKSHTSTRRERQDQAIGDRVARCAAAGCKIVIPVERAPRPF